MPAPAMTWKWNGASAVPSRARLCGFMPLTESGISLPKFALSSFESASGADAPMRGILAGKSGLHASSMASIGVAKPMGSLANWLPKEIAPTSRPLM